MQLTIDGRKVTAKPGQRLCQIIAELGLEGSTLKDRPLAAKIAGEVFNLNYIPVRVQDANQDRPSIRAAMAASDGVVQLLRYSDPSGKDVYGRTVQFMLFLALHQLWPNSRATMNCTLGPALYIEVLDTPDFSADALKKRFAEMVQQNFPLIRKRNTTEMAISGYTQMGMHDKAALLQYRTESYFDQYVYEDFADYYYGELAGSTGAVSVWDILPAEGGFLFLYPDDQDPDQVADYKEQSTFSYRGNPFYQGLL